MQRDVYASLIKKRHKPMIPLMIHQVSGDITRENIFDEVFLGYKLRRIVLMTHMAGTPASKPRLSRDVIVQDFKQLKSIHQPHFHYKLLPLLCADFETFAALQGVCASANSPFTIEDRRDPGGLTHRLSNGCAERQSICEFFDKYISPAEREEPIFSRRLPISSVGFDGLMIARNPKALQKQAALLTLHEAATEKSITERGILRDFYASPIYTKISGNSEIMQAMRLVHETMHFMAVKRRVGDEGSRKTLLHSASAKQVFIYEKIGDEYHFAHL